MSRLLSSRLDVTYNNPFVGSSVDERMPSEGTSPADDVETGNNNVESGAPHEELEMLQLHTSFMNNRLVTLWIFLIFYFIFTLVFWYEARNGNEAKWRVVYPAFLAIQLFAISKEIRTPALHLISPLRYKRAYLTHRILHHVCVSVTSYVVACRLDDVIHRAHWATIFTPMWVDVTCGLVLLWYSYPSMHDVGDNVMYGYIRTSIVTCGIVHFLSCGPQILLLALKLDDKISWEWPKVLAVWCGLLIMIGIKLFHLSFKIGMQCYPPLLHYWSTLSFCKKIMVVETTAALVLIWAWMCIGFRTGSEILEFLTTFEKNDDDEHGTFFSVISTKDIDSLFWPLSILLCSTVMILPMIGRTLTFYFVAGIQSIRCPHQETLSMEPLSSPMSILRVSSSAFEVNNDVLEGLNNPEKTTGKSIMPPPRSLTPNNNSAEMMEVSSNGTKEEVEENVNICFVCLTYEKPNAVLLDCNHGGLCYECAKALIEHGDRNCPICRQQIKIILRIPDEVLESPDEGIGCHFEVTEGVNINMATFRRTSSNLIMSDII